MLFRSRPTIALVAIAMLAGCAYLGAVYFVVIKGVAPGMLPMVGVGIALRVVLFPSTPILEDDFYRYFFDGAAVAHGVNPYGLAPEDGLEERAHLNEPGATEALARINHAHLATIYPPVAQAGFALAHFAGPFSLWALRGTLLLFDGATLVALVFLLRQLSLPVAYALIYWWNPLLVLETVNRAHMDVMVLPFLVGAVVFALRGRAAVSGVGFALAAACKLWPLMLAPLFLRAWKGGAGLGAVAGAMSFVVLMVPMAASISLGDRSGLLSYAEHWEMNDALYMVTHRVAVAATGLVSSEDSRESANLLARGLTAALVLGLACAMALRGARDGRAFCGQVVLVLGALFMLSPTQYPWYYVWLLPFLACAPRASLLVLTAMLPLYFLKFWFEAHGDVRVFHHGVVWVEYAPTLVLAAGELWRETRRGNDVCLG